MTALEEIANSPLKLAIENYDNKLTALEEASEKLKARQKSSNTRTKVFQKNDTASETTPEPSPEDLKKLVVDVLVARDAVDAALADKTLDSTREADIVNFIRLDHRLKKQSEFICETVDLFEWRKSLKPSPEAWWWQLNHKWDCLDWMWSGLSIACLTGSLSILVNISSRFLSGGPDLVGAFAITSQSVLALLAAKGALTEGGKEFIEGLLEKLNVRRCFWQEAQLVLSAFLLLGLIGSYSKLPSFGDYYRERGVKEYYSHNFASAEASYKQALELNPDDEEAHYRLGVLYEKLQDLNRARTEYQYAALGGYDSAYNSLARLYIRDKKYDAATFFLLEGLKQDVKQQLKETNELKIKYALYKNLGWVRLNQNRLEEAQAQLKQAIELAENPAAFKQPEERPASAYCLLAQVLQKQHETSKELAEWENCIRYANSGNPDEDAWIGLAQQRWKDLNTQQTSKEK